MSLRFPRRAAAARAAALAVTLCLPALATAQTADLTPAGPAIGRAASAFRAGSPSAAPASASSVVACTAGQQILPVTATFNATVTSGGQELGQSFTAPCDGFLSSIGIVIQVTAAQAGTTLGFRLNIYDGAGTGGTLVSSNTVTQPLPAAGAYNYTPPLADTPPVVSGNVYTFFLDITAGSIGIQGSDAVPNPYAGGDLYFTLDGNPATAQASPQEDLRFTATFNPGTTVATPTVFNRAGWRLLSPPVSGITVSDLADRNLVQQVPAGVPAALYPAEYPTAPGTIPNLLTFYNGSALAGPASTGVVPQSGRGFFWYWYDQVIPANPGGPFGGGTSASVDLAGFSLSATGAALTANLARAVLLTTDGTYMLGNPFAAPFRLSGLAATAGGGTLGTVFSVYDPAVGAGSYVPLGPTGIVAPWQGFFVDNPGATANPTFTYAVTSTDPAATPPFYGRGAADIGVRFRLDGATADGPTTDVAAIVRFLPDALAGTDPHDGTKLLPPGGPYALLAPVLATTAGAARLSVNSLPVTPDAVAVPLALLATAAGTFTLSWENTLEPGRTASLRDLVTGATVDLGTAADYAFESDATDWADRFELVVAGVAVATEDAPQAARVGTFAPNPTTGTARLSLVAEAAQTVRAAVVDALGREVAVVFEGAVAAGTSVTLTVDTARLPAGVYVVRVTGETFAETRRLTVVR